MFSLFFVLSSSNNPYYSLDSKINQQTYCGEADTAIDFFPPFNTKFLFVVNSIDEGVQMTVHSPSTSRGRTVNPYQNNSLLFTSGMAKVSFAFSKEHQCVTIASMALPECSTGIEVITHGSYIKTIQAARNQDYCIFFAPSSNNSYWRSTNTHLGNGEIYVYKDLATTYLTLKSSDQVASPSNEPWFFNYHSTETAASDETGCTLNLTCTTIDNNAIQTTTTPISYSVQPDKPDRSVFYPIFGSVCPIALLVVVVATLVTLYKKNPVEGAIVMKN